MKTVFKIFRKDIRNLSHNILALIVAIGLCIIPSLYAWFNIYSNWDPYANTSSLKVAVMSCDTGYTGTDGDSVNMGSKIIEQLHDNKNMGWLFCDTKEEALEGVYSGEYYAAIIIGEDFSENLYDFLEKGLNHPSVTYYENSKKNAVASKITDTARSTLQQSINTEFINVVAETSIENMNKLSEMNSGKLSEITQNISSIRDNLLSYLNTVDAFSECNEKLSQDLLNIKDTIPEAQAVVDTTINSANTTQSTVSEAVSSLTSQMESVLDVINIKAQSMNTHISNAADSAQSDAQAASDELSAAVDDIASMMEQNQRIQEIIDKLSKLDGLNLKIVDRIKSDLTSIELVENLAKKLIEQSSSMVKDVPVLVQAKYDLLKPILDECSSKVEQINDTFNNVVSENIRQLEESMAQSVETVTSQLSQAGSSLSGIEQLLIGTNDIVLTANTSLADTKTVISQMSEKITTIVDKLSQTGDSEAYKAVVSLLGADASTYAQFFAEPVEISQINVYNAVNYGTAVTPFYTTLALWVGALILAALIKVHVNYKARFVKNATNAQLYFGRFLLFFVMGQLQSAIIVFGDLYLLHVECDNPKLFFITAAITSMVFTLFIYTLVISFGDVGKAIAVVMVVIQIAGSSGTFPIELLPEFFKNVYIYFPFPYAINAMREAISGVYGWDYFTYISKLLIFMVVALVIGLLIRIPFMGLNHFMEKRMKDTEMM